MDIVKKVIKFLIFPLLVRIPGYRMIAQKVCKICNPRKGTLSKLISMSFWNNCYFQLPPGERMDMQLLLMGGDEGVGWAQKYQVKEHLESGRSKVGALDFLDACPAFDRISRFLEETKDQCSVIQIGASSGKDIVYFAKRYPKHIFYYTDIFDSVVEYAKSHHNLKNIEFLVASAEEIHLIASLVGTKNVLIFSMSALTYVFPESLSRMFARLSKISQKQITIIFDEPGNDLKSDPLLLEGSLPRSNFSYTHNYSHYAKNNCFQVLEWKKISPYIPQKDYPAHKGTIHLHGFFDNSGRDIMPS